MSRRERVVSARGSKLFVREQGSGHPLLMINGIGANADLWGRTEEALARRCRTIVFDAPGTGRSSTPVLPLTMSRLAEAALDLLDELGYERADVLGFSFGGCVAQELARAAPHRVRRLALVSTACGWGAAPGELAGLAFVATPARYYSRTLHAGTNRLLVPPDRRVSERLVDERLRHPPSALGYAYQLLAGIGWSSLAWLDTVEAPTLVVAGARDQITPAANGVLLARLLPHARLCTLRDEGHLVLFDPESEAHPLLADFFSSPELARSHAWSEAVEVLDDATVKAAMDASAGAQPLQTMSAAFRRFVARAVSP